MALHMRTASENTNAALSLPSPLPLPPREKGKNVALHHTSLIPEVSFIISEMIFIFSENKQKSFPKHPCILYSLFDQNIIIHQKCLTSLLESSQNHLLLFVHSPCLCKFSVVIKYKGRYNILVFISLPHITTFSLILLQPARDAKLILFKLQITTIQPHLHVSKNLQGRLTIPKFDLQNLNLKFNLTPADDKRKTAMENRN